MNQEEQWLLSEKYGGEKTGGFFTDLELLNSGTPLAYLIGSIPFLDCIIYLDSHPLIPRPETEYWVEKAIVTIRNCERNCVRNCDRKDVRKDERPYDTQVRGATPYFDELGIVSLRVLDLCAGSGAIGVAVAKAVSKVQVDFAEIDPSHLPTIEKNIEMNFPKPSIRMEGFGSDLFEGDLFGNIPTCNKYDFILTNPPYIDPEIDMAQESVKLHEPHLALYGGVGGMECIAKIIDRASENLTSTGQLWIEHEPEQSGAIMKLAEKHNFACVTHKDQYEVERYSILVLQ